MWDNTVAGLLLLAATTHQWNVYNEYTSLVNQRVMDNYDDNK